MLQAEMTDESKALVESAISEVGEIATLPEITVKIIQIVEDPKSTARDLHDVIKNDPALSTRILKVVNSAFYGLPGQISSIDRAIVLLGLSAVKNIAIAASMTHLFHGGADIEGFSGTEVWRHSVAVGVAARMLSTAQGRPPIEESFLAGLISDLGLLIERQIYAKQLTEVLARYKNDGGDYCHLETELIGADHQAFGMALAGKWRFPQILCTTIGYHHKPMDLAEANRELPALVHVADILACRSEIGFCTYAPDMEIAPELLEVIKLKPEGIEEVYAEYPEQVSMAESIFSE
ncbi:MAG: HDOD domain-containing protein [Phycisphaerales bacterium]|nr:HDOD domain-containing protein [Phycisphaerales bacterium]